MSKYLLSFILVAFVALEQSFIYGRHHSDTQTPSSTDSLQPYKQNRHLFHIQSPQQFHKRSNSVKNNRPRNAKVRRIRQSSWHNRNSDEAREGQEEAAAARRSYLHIQRHMAHQQEHLRHHQEEYHRIAESIEGQDEASAELQSAEQVEQESTTSLNMRLPRIWQHLGGTEDIMFSDAPRDYSDEVQHIADVKLPLTQALAESDEIDGFVPPAPEAHSNSLETADSEQNLATAHDEHRTAKSGCPKCESSRRVEHISEEELTQLRIEYVKQQILEKLRLKERPNVSAVGLPKPIYEGTTIDEEEDDGAKNKDLDDYYARTKKKFIFLQREKRECQRLGTNSSMCFSFKIDDADADGFDVNTAVLWLFKSRTKRSHRTNSTRIGPQTIVVSEVQQNTDPKYLPIVKTIAIQSIDVQDEWMKIDIEWPIKRWFGNHDLSHLIHISCRTCDMATMEKMISMNKDYRPFIMVDTQNRRRASRQKRGINCTDGVTECCREKLYISFDEIGWGDWIIQPRGYDAYFCRGSCGSVASVTQSATHHSAFLQKVALSRRNRGSKPLELIPCCTAKQYSSLQLVFMDSNNTATQKTFPNMVVESCGCR
ncbi:inhibin beta B chain [Anastrepha obliqua]|uniref:inhibin beta B chain n=1 Tax=Anastrepha obliqua TaxID=95512 RepID=UPI00240A20A6|nr:inhibin beta B chain [Anastrepha obliqua]XP_054743820.1 inhibin beta B chain [Anastrepha obliqua]XP_054743821.1 inhibin beta B chain [Anastrepha obliqua]XP_054743822.1 inhibin beta B chain [Anastrepha obliqua]